MHKIAPHVICNISDIDIFITDQMPPKNFRDIAKKNDTEIVIPKNI